jgi:hypothetical protein
MVELKHVTIRFAVMLLLMLIIISFSGTQLANNVSAQVTPSPSPSPSPKPTTTPSPTSTPAPTPKPSPTLLNGYVSPTSGAANTTFAYYVTYYDPAGTSPMSSLVVIDNIPYTMSIYSGTPSNGIYRYSTNLAIKAHTYYFMFTSGSSGQTVWFGWPTQLSGPTVTGPTPTSTPTPTALPTPIPPTATPTVSPTPSPTPTPPPATLSNGNVSPISGFTDTSYTFFVNYYDTRGANASSPLVFIDSTPYLMSIYSGSASNGVYSYVTSTLSAGIHTFYFIFTSGSSGQNVSLYWPNQFSGPTVTTPTPAPTPSPTTSPTTQPTQNPTLTPQQNNPTPKSTPTPTPSPSPSPKPTASPTSTPTATINPYEVIASSDTAVLRSIVAGVIILISLAAILIAASKKQAKEPQDELHGKGIEV